MFAFLLGFGVLRSLFDVPHSAAVPLFSVLMAGLYVYGTVLERHRARAQVEISNSAKYAWLTGILVLWLMLLTHSQYFFWLYFPLFFFILHISACMPARFISLGFSIVTA